MSRLGGKKDSVVGIVAPLLNSDHCRNSTTEDSTNETDLFNFLRQMQLTGQTLGSLSQTAQQARLDTQVLSWNVLY